MQDPYEPLAAYYDLEHSSFRRDIDFYLRALDPCAVLEIGVGTGRIALPLADVGFEVWGVDPSSAMLAVARSRLAHRPSVHLIHSSILDAELPRKFPAAIFSLNTLWHLPDPASQLAAIGAVRLHLVPGAIAIVDLSNPHTLADRDACGELRMRFSKEAEGARITGLSAAWDDPRSQHLHLELMYDRVASSGELTRSHATLDLRYIFREELESMLVSCGFTPRHRYGSYDLDPYDEESESLLVVAEAI